MPSGVVLHCRLCRLVWCLTIGHAWWCGTSLSAIPLGGVPHYRQCLLAWYLTIGKARWSVATVTDILFVEGRWKKDDYKSGATCTCQLIQGTLSDMPACTVQPYQTCMLGSFIKICVFCKVLLHRARLQVCYISARHGYR